MLKFCDWMEAYGRLIESYLRWAPLFQGRLVEGKGGFDPLQAALDGWRKSFRDEIAALQKAGKFATPALQAEAQSIIDGHNTFDYGEYLRKRAAGQRSGGDMEHIIQDIGAEVWEQVFKRVHMGGTWEEEFPTSIGIVKTLGQAASLRASRARPYYTGERRRTGGQTLRTTHLSDLAQEKGKRSSWEPEDHRAATPFAKEMSEALAGMIARAAKRMEEAAMARAGREGIKPHTASRIALLKNVALVAEMMFDLAEPRSLPDAAGAAAERDPERAEQIMSLARGGMASKTWGILRIAALKLAETHDQLRWVLDGIERLAQREGADLAKVDPDVGWVREYI